MTAKKRFSDMLRTVPELSVDGALHTAGGSDESYERVVRLTMRLLPENINKLNKLIETDPHLYAIAVHGIRGVLNNIGAYELGETALKLETLVDAGDIDASAALHLEFIRALTNFSDVMTALLKEPPDADKPAGDIAALLEALPKIKEAADFFDSILALEILSPVRKFSYGPELDGAMEELTRAFERFDFDKAEVLIKELKMRC